MRAALALRQNAVRSADTAGRHRFLLLLVSLVGLLLLSPLIGDGGPGDRVLTGLFTFVLLAAILAASDRRFNLAAAAALAVPWMYLSWLHPVWRGDEADVIASVVLIGLLGHTLRIVLGSVLRADTVDRDILAGAIAVYLLLGVTWTIIFGLIEAVAPGSFKLTAANPDEVWNQLLYFSFTTLTTLGYGDITPISAVARMWSTLEAAAGTLYLAVLVARLVGLYKGRPPQGL